MQPIQSSSTAEHMRALTDEVFAVWERRVRNQVQEAATLTEPIITNSLPILYRGITDAIESRSLRDFTGLTSSVGSEHGNERARVTAYDMAAVIKEYQILRATIVDILEEHAVMPDSVEWRILNAMIDLSISESATGFAMTQSVFRERFVATLAHDLRNPLNASLMAAQMIMRTSDPEAIVKLATRIQNNSIRMNGMIEDLLDNVVFESGERLHLELTEFDIKQLVQDVVEQSREIHENEFQFRGESVVGWWGFEPLRRALENLIGNAVKYGQQGGKICVDLSDGRGRIILSVHNFGTPIPASQVESIFKVFQRANQNKDNAAIGWGLGLPYVRRVAESHGGSISAHSTENKGTTFTIDIPVDARPFEKAPVLGV